MINTYNESDLHALIKKCYALESNGTMEVQLDDTPWICDIMTEENTVIEVQTANLSALTEKAAYILETGRKLKIVHPIASVKWIELYANDGTLLHRKKSPKKAGIFDSLRGMTKICPLLLHENCELEILNCEVTELRRETKEPSQTVNNARRHLKNWLPMGKRLEKIISKERFSKKSDWEQLIPESLRTRAFRACDLTKAIKEARGAKNARWANLLIWIFVRMNILTVAETRGRSKYYELKTES